MGLAMIRNYDTQQQRDDVVFFTGYEVEKTPAYGLRTLFVTGLQDTAVIEKHYTENHCEHIFFGANHSYSPDLSLPESHKEWEQWDTMILHFLKRDYLCTLDIPVSHCEYFLDGPCVEFDCFIPQIRISVPYIKQWNYNTMVKIDDKGFRSSNPGVWCHRMHDLMQADKFTDWRDYGLDTPVDKK